ncbi:hypothetical protein J7T55_000331 [Diaporthe amygdali]|uniref:uncharacterized protein n=1 Tax=Phomopsis amygdali TaxID=1214568 RepID=UPI0022FE8787|nr:uncharacterized protein J7T55_000331 [Diaporthe amygdali]KAJ0109406.1 hypothetical protein J7T55_000331 [Diaporthe amygdali]
MSGLEVAGLVLGAFPVALEILDKYKEVARRFGFWYKIAAEHRNCDSQLKFHRFVYIDNLKKLLLPLAGLDDTHIDELLQDPGGKAWSEARTAEQLKQRLGDSHEIYMQFMNEFQEWLHAIRTKLAFDPETKQQSRESLSAEANRTRSRTEMLKDRGKWQFYRIKFSQEEKERSEIFAKLQSCNDRLKTLLQISEDDAELARERASTRKNEPSSLCHFWRQAGSVFTALSMVWNSTEGDFSLLYNKSAQRPREARRIKITANGADLDNSAAIKLRPHKPSVGAYAPSHRTSIPRRSAMRASSVLSTGEFRSRFSVTITQVENSSTQGPAFAPSTNPITDLCLSLESSIGQFCGFIDDNDYRYYVYQDIAVPGRSNTPKMITLDQLLRQDGFPIPKRRQRVALAFILSSSFLQLLETPWLPASWQKSDIVFFDDPDNPGVFKLDEPHLRISLESKTESSHPDYDCSSVSSNYWQITLHPTKADARHEQVSDACSYTYMRCIGPKNSRTGDRGQRRIDSAGGAVIDTIPRGLQAALQQQERLAQVRQLKVWASSVDEYLTASNIVMDTSSGAEIQLRQRQRSDLPRLHDIITAVYEQTGYPVDGPSCFEDFLDPPSDQVLYTITAVLKPTVPETENEQPIAGHAMIMSPSSGALNLASKVHLQRGGTMENHAVLSRFFVNPAVQARGIGSKMLEEVTAWGRRERKRLVLIVLEKDEGAIRLYDRAGWVRVGEYVFTSKWGTGYNAIAYLGPQ